jgi:hypothetical protein
VLTIHTSGVVVPSTVVAIGEPFPPVAAHQAGTSVGGDAAVTVSARRSGLLTVFGQTLVLMVDSVCRTT